jgi:hypothetical protein
MAISRKGRRRIVVGGRIFYWDLRSEGKKPGQRQASWEWPGDGRKAVVRVISEDKRWRLTFESYAGRNGGKVLIDPGAKTFRFLDQPGQKPSWPITPASIRQLIEKYFDRPSP